jgi:hypothetical protein
MGTTYSEVFDSFKDNIIDPDLLQFAQELQNDMLLAIMKKAIVKCQRVVKQTVDLLLRNDEIMEFEHCIPEDVLDILTEWMTVVWLKPYVNNIENLRNNLSTKDFSSFSPANLLDKIGDRYEKSRKYAKSITNEYSYVIADMKGLKT